MKREKKRILLSWSSGKDSTSALHIIRQQSDVELAGLLTTFNENFDRVAMHAVRTGLLRRQAESLGLPLRLISPPFPCSNEIYEERLRVAIGATQSDGIEGVAFGDLFLAEVRQSRESQSRESQSRESQSRESQSRESQSRESQSRESQSRERMMEGSGINRFSPYGDAQQQNWRGRWPPEDCAPRSRASIHAFCRRH